MQDIFEDKNAKKKEKLWKKLQAQNHGANCLWWDLGGGGVRLFHSIHRYGNDYYNPSDHD